MTSLSLRDARADESDEIAALTRAAYEEFGSAMEPSAWRALQSAMDGVLRHSGAADRIVAEQDERIVGSVFLYPAGVDAYDAGDKSASPEIRLLAVAPHARGRGVARRLVEECIRRARASGASEIGLHTSKSLASAIALYERMGFARVPERDFHPDGAELVQAYRLSL
jgi:ribosomal protein S18 acetylase RimI-like enzyme